MAEEDESKRLDQEWKELLEELRVVLPGVTVIFSFLLSIPFANRFTQLGERDKNIYFAAFVSAALATLLLTAPSVHHRLLWRQHDKPWLLTIATWFAIGGAALTAVTIASVVFLVTDLLYGNRTGAIAMALAAGLVIWFWYGVPLAVRMRRSSPREHEGLRGPSSR